LVRVAPFGVFALWRQAPVVVIAVFPCSGSRAIAGVLM
jgi:hypothetical protein